MPALGGSTGRGSLLARVSATLAVVVSLACAACAQPSTLPEIKGAFISQPSGQAGEAFTFEVCTDETERARGLMFRKELAANRGMVFVFPVEREHAFWMKNTYIPLDMLFVSKDLTIVGVLENVTPLTETRRTVGKPSTYVVELAGGVAQRAGIRAGDKIRFDGQLPAPR